MNEKTFEPFSSLLPIVSLTKLQALDIITHTKPSAIFTASDSKYADATIPGAYAVYCDVIKDLLMFLEATTTLKFEDIERKENATTKIETEK